MGDDRHIHLGLVVYHWGPEEQNRLLAESIGPAARHLRREGLAERFWFDRFGARGPHVFAILTLRAAAAAPAEALLADRLTGFLTARPSTVALIPEELAARHAACRGKTQCLVDREPGFAPNNSWRFFEHSSRGYPFVLTEGLQDEEELWDLLADLTFWALEGLSAPPGAAAAAAIRWLASLDRELRAARDDAAELWRYHAATLLPGLEDQLRAKGEELLSAAPALIGAKNLATCSSIWREAADGRSPWPPVRRLVEIALQDPRRSWPILREIVHVTLKQLGMPVGAHAPLVLFAWARPGLAADTVAEMRR